MIDSVASQLWLLTTFSQIEYLRTSGYFEYLRTSGYCLANGVASHLWLLLRSTKHDILLSNKGTGAATYKRKTERLVAQQREGKMESV